MECNHVFKGHADGVTCIRCGLRMTTGEYMAYIGTTEAAKKPKRARKPKEEQDNE